MEASAAVAVIDHPGTGLVTRPPVNLEEAAAQLEAAHRTWEQVLHAKEELAKRRALCELIAKSMMPERKGKNGVLIPWTWQEVMFLEEKGRQHGMNLIEALDAFWCYNGTIEPKYQYVLARIQAIYGNAAFRFIEAECTVAEYAGEEKTADPKLIKVTAEVRLHPDDEPQVVTYNAAQAVVAGLWGKNVWQFHPDDMMRKTLIQKNSKRYFPQARYGTEANIAQMTTLIQEADQAWQKAIADDKERRALSAPETGEPTEPEPMQQEEVEPEVQASQPDDEPDVEVAPEAEAAMFGESEQSTFEPGEGVEVALGEQTTIEGDGSGEALPPIEQTEEPAAEEPEPPSEEFQLRSELLVAAEKDDPFSKRLHNWAADQNLPFTEAVKLANLATLRTMQKAMPKTK